MPAAVCVTKGIRFIGTPIGNSPINADGWAPIGLKYLKMTAFTAAPLWMKSCMISSLICFVLP